MNKPQKIIAICGVKNSGKTTLIEKLTKGLVAAGVKVAVIKHDGHDFDCDVAGTDSDRFSKAGAYGTAVFSKYRSFIHKAEPEPKVEALIDRFPEAEMILIEGLKESEYPKIELIRSGISNKPVSNPKNRFLIVTDQDLQDVKEPMLDFNEVDEMIRLFIER